MTSLAQGAGKARGARPGPFRPYHPWDRRAFLGLIGLIWLGILAGFGGDIAHHIQTHAAPFPPIVHAHAVIFLSWLVLLTVQAVLIGRGQVALHRRLGVAGLALALAMVVIGPITAVLVDRAKFGQPGFDAPFLIVQFADILAFASLAGAAFLLRRASPAHKRLMLLATCFIADAGFSRWLAPGLAPYVGMGYAGQWAMDYLGNDLVILSLGAYDLVTRGRLHPAYVAGVAWIAVLQAAAPAIYLADWWQPVSAHLLGH